MKCITEIPWYRRSMVTSQHMLRMIVISTTICLYTPLHDNNYVGLSLFILSGNFNYCMQIECSCGNPWFFCDILLKDLFWECQKCLSRPTQLLLAVLDVHWQPTIFKLFPVLSSRLPADHACLTITDLMKWNETKRDEWDESVEMVELNLW